MAEDTTVESPNMGDGEQSLEALRQTLADKQEELVGLRAQREQSLRDASVRVEREQVEAQIARIDAEIANEKQQLEVQQNLDAQLVGTGVASEPVEVKPIVDPENPEQNTLPYGGVADPVEPVAPVSPETSQSPEEGNEGSDH